MEPRGLDELVRLTTELLPAVVRRAFISAQSIAIDLKADQGRGVVVAATGAAAVAAAVPVPAADAVMLMPTQLGMLAGVTAVFGVDLSDEQAKKLISAVTAGSKVCRRSGKRWSSSSRSTSRWERPERDGRCALTGAMGEAYVRLCIEMLRREAAGKPMPDADMLEFFTSAYQGILRKSKQESGRAETAQPAVTAGPADRAPKAPPRSRAARPGAKPRSSVLAARSADGTPAKRTSSSRASGTKTAAKLSSRPRKPSADS
jgi:hypothetical protein